jgi:hypothetical protein
MSNTPVSVIENTMKCGDLDVKTFQRSDWVMPSVWCFKCEYSNELKEYLTNGIYDKTHEFYPIFNDESNPKKQKLIMCKISQTIVNKTHDVDRDDFKTKISIYSKIDNLDVIYRYLYDLIKNIVNDIHYKLNIIFNSYDSINFNDYLIYSLQSRLFIDNKTQFSYFHTNFRIISSIRVITYILGFIDDITHLNVALNRNMTNKWGLVNNNTHSHIIKKVEVTSDFNTVVWDDFNMLHRTPVLVIENLPRFFFSVVYFHKNNNISIKHNRTMGLSNSETKARLNFNKEGYVPKIYRTPNDYIRPLDDILKNILVDELEYPINQNLLNESIGKKYKLLIEPIVRINSKLNSRKLTQNIRYKKDDDVTIYDIEKITKGNGEIVYRCRITPKTNQKSHWITLKDTILEKLPNNKQNRDNNRNYLYNGGNNNKYDSGSIHDKINKFSLKTLQEYAKLNDIKYNRIRKKDLITLILE